MSMSLSLSLSHRALTPESIKKNNQIYCGSISTSYFPFHALYNNNIYVIWQLCLGKEKIKLPHLSATVSESSVRCFNFYLAFLLPTILDARRKLIACQLKSILYHRTHRSISSHRAINAERQCHLKFEDHYNMIPHQFHYDSSSVYKYNKIYFFLLSFSLLYCRWQWR